MGSVRSLEAEAGSGKREAEAGSDSCEDRATLHARHARSSTDSGWFAARGSRVGRCGEPRRPASWVLGSAGVADRRLAPDLSRAAAADRLAGGLGGGRDLLSAAARRGWRSRSRPAAATSTTASTRPTRPELFFKATPHRVGGHGQPVRIRRDANWNVPEPELTLVVNSPRRDRRLHDRQRHELARHRGREPAVSAAGEGLRRLLRARARRPRPSQPLADRDRDPLRIAPERRERLRGTHHPAAMERTFAELIDYLGRDNTFPARRLLLTGTGIVPPDDSRWRPATRVRDHHRADRHARQPCAVSPD